MYRIVRVIDCPEMKQRAAEWFNSKFNIPIEAYLESMDDCLSGDNAVPQWYNVVDGDRIIAGCGIIANDFHDRPDLTPNLCALYVEARYCRKTAGLCSRRYEEYGNRDPLPRHRP